MSCRDGRWVKDLELPSERIVVCGDVTMVFEHTICS
jgi:hypothetical protein